MRKSRQGLNKSREIVTPGEFYLKLITNAPNPFTGGADIIYELEMRAEISVKIFTISGERVAEIKGSGERGSNNVYRDGRNKGGKEAASGVCVYSVEARAQGRKEVCWGKMAAVR